jgi:hypothetical protein
MTEHSSGTLTLRPARLMARLDYFEKFIDEPGRLKRVFLYEGKRTGVAALMVGSHIDKRRQG